MTRTERTTLIARRAKQLGGWPLWTLGAVRRWGVEVAPVVDDVSVLPDEQVLPSLESWEDGTLEAIAADSYQPSAVDADIKRARDGWDADRERAAAACAAAAAKAGFRVVAECDALPVDYEAIERGRLEREARREARREINRRHRERIRLARGSR